VRIPELGLSWQGPAIELRSWHVGTVLAGLLCSIPPVKIDGLAVSWCITANSGNCSRAQWTLHETFSTSKPTRLRRWQKEIPSDVTIHTTGCLRYCFSLLSMMQWKECRFLWRKHVWLCESLQSSPWSTMDMWCLAVPHGRNCVHHQREQDNPVTPYDQCVVVGILVRYFVLLLYVRVKIPASRTVTLTLLAKVHNDN
jgi:hypothetical protein